ncbi:uncharacterized protein BDV17DRAFT_289702 [Aspergillus undulatus]|uniref:uncharacterized protein n=1 Tax=Aspergillus undulatus TaxID=1810928 RepID=UPI003CCD309C
MSTTTTTTASATAAISTCHAELYNIPTHDAACAMPKNDTYHSLMSSCCGSASVITYSDCGYYCLAQGQTVGDLAECLIKGSAAGQVWCNNGANATATGTASATASETGNASTSATDDGSTDPTGTNGAEALVGPSVTVKATLVLALLAFGGVAPIFA